SDPRLIKLSKISRDRSSPPVDVSLRPSTPNERPYKSPPKIPARASLPVCLTCIPDIDQSLARWKRCVPRGDFLCFSRVARDVNDLHEGSLDKSNPLTVGRDKNV